MNKVEWYATTLSHDKNTDIREYMVFAKLNGKVFQHVTLRFDPNTRHRDEFTLASRRLIAIIAERVEAFLAA